MTAKEIANVAIQRASNNAKISLQLIEAITQYNELYLAGRHDEARMVVVNIRKSGVKRHINFP